MSLIELWRIYFDFILPILFSFYAKHNVFFKIIWISRRAEEKEAIANVALSLSELDRKDITDMTGSKWKLVFTESVSTSAGKLGPFVGKVIQVLPAQEHPQIFQLKCRYQWFVQASVRDLSMLDPIHLGTVKDSKYKQKGSNISQQVFTKNSQNCFWSTLAKYSISRTVVLRLVCRFVIFAISWCEICKTECCHSVPKLPSLIFMDKLSYCFLRNSTVLPILYIPKYLLETYLWRLEK